MSYCCVSYGLMSLESSFIHVISNQETVPLLDVNQLQRMLSWFHSYTELYANNNCITRAMHTEVTTCIKALNTEYRTTYKRARHITPMIKRPLIEITHHGGYACSTFYF